MPIEARFPLRSQSDVKLLIKSRNEIVIVTDVAGDTCDKKMSPVASVTEHLTILHLNILDNGLPMAHLKAWPKFSKNPLEVVVTFGILGPSLL